MKQKGSVFIIESSGRLVEMAEEDYDSEDLLQELLEKYPNLLAGDQIDQANPRRWVLVSREMPVPDAEDSGGRWSLDHLFIDQDGIPTLVEVKRSSDTRIRREVVGQMFDYAANGLAYWPLETIQARFVDQCEKNKTDPDAILRDLAGVETAPAEFWDKVQVNLRAGKVRMLFVADSLPPELQRIIEFVNGQMSPAEVLGVEIKLFRSGDLKTLVPRVIGKTRAADDVKGKKRSSAQWDEESFLEDLTKRVSPEEAKTAKAILEWGKAASEGFIYWGIGQSYASFVPLVYVNGVKRQAFNLFSTGSLEVYFHWYAYKAPFDSTEKRMQMLEMLNKMDGVNLPAEAINKRPSIPLNILTKGDNLKKFLATMDWWLEQVRSG